MTLRLTLSVTLCAAALAAASFFAGRAVSDEPPPGMPPEMVEKMKEWEKMKAPGPQHELLKGLEGTWVGKGTWTEEGMTSKFTEEVTSKLIYGGRFLHSEAKMTVDAGPMGSMSMTSTLFLGYDNAKQKYQHAMLGEWSTGLGTAEGTYDAATKKLTLTGTEVLAPGKERTYRMVQTLTSATEWGFEMYFTTDGKEAKVGEGVYKRK